MSKTISDLIEVKNPRVAKRYLKKKVAMGHFIEDYISEKVDIKVSFMELLKYKNDIFSFNFVASHYYFFISRMIPEVIIHSQKQDKRIIKSHYDNKNDLFSWFLGTKMIYTSCYFKNLDESLEEAQENKLNLIAQKMQLKEGEELLDIGCGWGTLVAHLAKHYGVNTTGVTIAPAGAEWATRQIQGIWCRGSCENLDNGL